MNRLHVCVGIVVVASGLGCSSGGGGADAGCQSETDQSFCARLGKNCDVLSAFDNCGASRSVNCGSCAVMCQDNVCVLEPATSGGGTTGGGTTGGTSGGGTTGGTTGGGDSGCAAGSCPGFAQVLSASFVLGMWNTHDDATLDSLVGEHINIVIGLNAGAGQEQEGGFSFPTGAPEVSVSGDSSDLIAADMVPSWETGSPLFDENGDQIDFELLPSNQSGDFYTFEMFCSTGASPGTLVSATCGSPTVIVRYFTGGSSLADSISSPSITAALFVADGG